MSGRARKAFNRPNPSSRGIITSDNTRSGRTPLSIKSSACLAVFRRNHRKSRLQQSGNVFTHVAIVVDEKDSWRVECIARRRGRRRPRKRRKRAALFHVRKIRQPTLRLFDERQRAARVRLSATLLRHLCARQMRSSKRNAYPKSAAAAPPRSQLRWMPPCSLTSSRTSDNPIPEPSWVRPLGPRDAIKAVEELRQGVGGYAGAGVRDHQLGCSIAGCAFRRGFHPPMCI